MENLFLDLAISLLNLVKPVISAFSPLITGLVLAYLLNPAAAWFESRLKSRKAAIAVTLFLTFSALCGLLYGFVVLIAGASPDDFAAAAGLVRDYFDNAMKTAQNFIADYVPQLSADISQEAVRTLQHWLESRFSLASIVDAVSGFTGGIVSFLAGVVAAVYLLNDKEFFIGLWEKFLVLVLHQKSHGIICEIMSDIHGVITTFVKGAMVDSIIVAFLSSLVLTVTGTDFAVIIGIAAGFLNIIPYFGPFISMVPAFFVALFTGGPFQGLLAAGSLFIVQQLDANYIYPKIVGATTGLHPLFVLLAVSVLGSFLGIAGMLLAVPAAGIIQVFVVRWACKK